MKIDFDKSAAAWLSVVLDDEKREQTLQKKQGTRKLSLWFAMVGAGLIFISTIMILIAGLMQEKIDMGFVAFNLIIIYSLAFAYEKLDTEIKLLKLAGALKEAQQTKDDTASL
jgi:hypothetical protein